MQSPTRIPRPLRPGKELAFTIKDIARLIRTVADQEVSRLGMTQAQWSVLSRLEMHQGLKQSEIAEMLDLQPITLTRLLDKLAKSGLIERRPDPQDRRAWRLYLTDAARPLMDQLDELGGELGAKVLDGIAPAQVKTMLNDLAAIRENLRRALNVKSSNNELKRYG
jgi:MarR family transcriptional regulator for hemolysin